jgi:ERCC4-type nuclease
MRAEMKKMSDKASDSLDEPSRRIDSEPHALEEMPVNDQSVTYNQASDNATIGTQCSYHCENATMNAIQITRDGPYAHEAGLMVTSEKRQMTLLDFEKDDMDTIRTTVDVLELRTDVIDETLKLGARPDITPLPVTDYMLSGKNTAERKTSKDVVSTLMDHTLFEQTQIEMERGPVLRGKKSTKTWEEQQEYLISSIASIGPIAAGALLKHFGSLEAIIKAPEEQLAKVKGIGKITAQKIREIINAKYALE